MARVKGREVVVELLDSVAKLEATAALHAQQMEALAELAMGMTATVTSLGSELRQVWRSVSELARRMDDVSKRMDGIERDLQTLAQGFVDAAGTARTAQQQTGRLAKILADLAEGNRSRFDDIEDRLVKLERKAG
jgi:ABC-type transporter Mla subunit MlaD